MLWSPAAARAQLSPPTDFDQTNYPADLQKLKDVGTAAHQTLKAAQDAAGQRLQSDPEFQSLSAKYQAAQAALDSAIASGDGIDDAAQAKMDAGSNLTTYEHDKIAADPAVTAAQSVADAADAAANRWIQAHHYTSAEEIVHMVPALTWLSQVTNMDRYYWGAQFFRKIDAELNQIVGGHPAVFTVAVDHVQGGSTDVIHAVDFTINHLTIHQHAAVAEDDSLSADTMLQVSGLLHATVDYENDGFVLDVGLSDASVLKSHLTVTTTADNARPNFGSNVVYTVKIANIAGPDTGTALDLKVKDTLSDGQAFVSAAPSPETSFMNGIWTIPQIDAGGEAILKVTATTNLFEAVSNTAEIQSEEVPNVTAYPHASVTIQPQLAKLHFDAQVDNPSPNVGDLVNITVNLNNDGSASPATGIIVTDPLPSGLTLQSASASVGTYDPQKGLWNVGGLPNGSTATLTLSAQATTAGEADNQATVTSQDQPNEHPSPQVTTEIDVHPKPPPPAPPPKPAIPPWAIPVGIGLVVMVIIILRR
ncbi:MAG TPA: DUF11 domain-containing protein [Tepidisphaeraceae bacterium]|nr:DUF11 domain-containing protein [Tepidisphaeraceae bacterium]